MKSLYVELNQFNLDIFIWCLLICTHSNFNIISTGLRELLAEPWRIVEAATWAAWGAISSIPHGFRGSTFLTEVFIIDEWRHNTRVCHTISWAWARVSISISIISSCKCPDVLSGIFTPSDTHSIHICTIKCNSTMVVIGPKGIWASIQVPSHSSTDFAVGNAMSIKHNWSTTGCPCPEASPFGTRGQFESLWTPLAGVSHIKICYPHPSLNISSIAAVCIWSTVDKGWTAGSTGNPEVARKATGADLSYLLAWVGWILKGTWMKVSTQL